MCLLVEDPSICAVSSGHALISFRFVPDYSSAYQYKMLNVSSSLSLFAKSGARFLLPLLRSSLQVTIQGFQKKHPLSSIGSSMDPVRHASTAPVASFQLSPSIALKLQKGDITVWSVDGSTDAIVNAANERMLSGGGVDGAIHRAAGRELFEACKKVPEVRAGIRCPTGEARITPAFRLPVAHVIHTVGPIYDMDRHPDVSLRNAYKNSLKVAKENSVQYVAFPAISCGVYCFPYKEASRIAISTVKEFSDGLKEVHFVLFPDELYNIWVETAQELL